MIRTILALTAVLAFGFIVGATLVGNARPTPTYNVTTAPQPVCAQWMTTNTGQQCLSWR